MQYVDTPIEDAIEIIQSITCPDGKSKCNDGETCCKANEVGYGCCPLPKAVCCKSGHNCCFHNTICCEGGGCCEQTCCGQHSCCPFPNGVCCEDGPHGHCCPHGTQCDIEHRGCRRGLSEFLPMLAKINNINPPMEEVSPFFMSCIHVFVLASALILL